MKTLPVMVIVCVVMTLTGADAKTPLIKNSERCRGWSEYDERCFLYVPTKLTWAKAEQNCQSQGGNLASIRDFFENHEIQKLIVMSTDGYPLTWIGGSDAEQEGVWRWSDGTPFRYANWCPGQPNNHRNQHCILMNFGAAKCWDDEKCHQHRPSVCLRKMR